MDDYITEALIEASSKKDNDTLNALLNDPRVYTPDNIVDLFKEAAYQGNLPIMEILLDDYKLYSRDPSESIKTAVLGNQYDALVFLLNDENIGTPHNYDVAIIEAINFKRKEIAERLIENGYFNCGHKDLTLYLGVRRWNDLANRVYQICGEKLG